MKAEILVAIIGAVGTVVAAWLGRLTAKTRAGRRNSRKPLFVFLGIFIAGACTTAFALYLLSTSRSGRPPSSESQKAIRAGYAKMAEAFAKRDLDAYKECLPPDFKQIL
ncbi:MAG: hypothetical protein WKF37_02670, partial [Bryobacteraceae bacterium]